MIEIRCLLHGKKEKGDKVAMKTLLTQAGALGPPSKKSEER